MARRPGRYRSRSVMSINRCVCLRGRGVSDCFSHCEFDLRSHEEECRNSNLGIPLVTIRIRDDLQRRLRNGLSNSLLPIRISISAEEPVSICLGKVAKAGVVEVVRALRIVGPRFSSVLPTRLRPILVTLVIG